MYRPYIEIDEALQYWLQLVLQVATHSLVREAFLVPELERRLQMNLTLMLAFLAALTIVCDRGWFGHITGLRTSKHIQWVWEAPPHPHTWRNELLPASPAPTVDSPHRFHHQ